MINYDNLTCVTTENVIAIVSTCKHICVFNTVPVHNYYTYNIGCLFKKQTNKR